MSGWKGTCYGQMHKLLKSGSNYEQADARNLYMAPRNVFDFSLLPNILQVKINE